MRFFKLPRRAAANSLLFSADGRHLAVGQPGGVAVFDPLGADGPVRVFDHELLGGVTGAWWRVRASAADGSFLASWGLQVRRVHPAGEASSIEFAPTGVFNFAISPDGSLAVAGLGTDGSGLRLWYVGNTDTAEHGWDVSELEGTAQPAFGFSPDGSALAVAGRGRAEGRGGRESVTVGNLGLHSTRDLERFYLIRLPFTSPQRVRWTPDGSRIVVFSTTSFAVFDNNRITDPPVRIVNPSRRWIMTETFHPDGQRMLTAGFDGLVRVWDTASWQVVTSYRWKVGKLSAVACSPDGTLCAAAGSVGRVVVWDWEV